MFDPEAPLLNASSTLEQTKFLALKYLKMRRKTPPTETYMQGFLDPEQPTHYSRTARLALASYRSKEKGARWQLTAEDEAALEEAKKLDGHLSRALANELWRYMTKRIQTARTKKEVHAVMNGYAPMWTHPKMTQQLKNNARKVIANRVQRARNSPFTTLGRKRILRNAGFSANNLPNWNRSKFLRVANQMMNMN